MKLAPRKLLVGLAVAGMLAIAPTAVGYAVSPVDSGIASRPDDTVERSHWVAGNGSLTDVRLDDNDNADVDDNVSDEAVDNDNADDIGNDNAVDNDNASDDGVDPGPSNNDPNNNGDGDSGNNGGGGENDGGGSDPSSGLE